jgi:ATP-independent RNA helicase DbpA
VATPPLDGTPRFRPSRYRTLLLLAGRKQKLRKGDVVGALVKDGGIPPEAIGDIRLGAITCAVALERAEAVKALRYLRQGRIKKARIRATLLGD